ncbi:hypothetical protein [Niabella aquatica]
MRRRSVVFKVTGLLQRDIEIVAGKKTAMITNLNAIVIGTVDWSPGFTTLAKKTLTPERAVGTAVQMLL